MRIEGNPQSPSSLPIKNEYELQEIVKTSQTGTGSSHLISEKVLEEMISKTNDLFEESDTMVQFTIHKETNQILVKLINSETKEVIKEIPPEKLVDLIYNICAQNGIFLDTRIGEGSKIE